MIFDPILDIFRGKAVTIPPLDGAFRPNTRLDDAPLWSAISEVDNLAIRSGEVVATSGNAVFAVGAGSEPRVLEHFNAPITALAVSPSGEIAVGLETGRLVIDNREVETPAAINCITAIAFHANGTLWLANGSARHSPSAWSADLMEKGRSGSLWKRDADTSVFREIESGLAFPYGLLVEGDGVVVSESWRHRLIRIDVGGNRSLVVDHLPGYPARLSIAADGGAWLSIFAPRNRLIEFVLQENHYRHDMMAQVPRDYWIAPALSSGRSFLEPLQCGGIKTMGIHKPWSPSRSYGMVVKLDAGLQPALSLHSRANGTRHGTCSAVELGDTLFVGSRGGDCILSIEIAEGL